MSSESFKHLIQGVLDLKFKSEMSPRLSLLYIPPESFFVLFVVSHFVCIIRLQRFYFIIVFDTKCKILTQSENAN